MIVPGAGRLVDLGGVGVQFKIDGPLTGGLLSIVEHPVEPGVIVEPHVHAREDELSYVLEGSIWVRVGDQEVHAEAGSYVWKPRGVLHTFWNPADQPRARLLEIISPAGFEVFFAELALLLETEGEPDPDSIAALTDRYGLTFDHSWIPEIEDRFGSLRMI